MVHKSFELSQIWQTMVMYQSGRFCELGIQLWFLTRNKKPIPTVVQEEVTIESIAEDEIEIINNQTIAIESNTTSTLSVEGV